MDLLEQIESMASEVSAIASADFQAKHEQILKSIMYPAHRAEAETAERRRLLGLD